MSFAFFWLKKEFKRPQTWALGLLMSLGLSGLALVDLFSNRISFTSEQDARNYLSADYSIQSWSIFKQDTLEEVYTLVGEDNVLLHRSLLASAKNNDGNIININLEAIDSSYPFYGNWTLKYSDEAFSAIENLAEVFVDPSLEALGYKQGDLITIGEKEFKIRDFVVQDPQALNFFGSGGYRVWMHRSQFVHTGLDTFGSRIRNRLYIRNPDEDPSVFRKRYREIIKDPTLRLRSAAQNNARTQRTNQILKTFLGLTALCATFMGLIGLFMIFVADLKQKLPQILTLRCLGIQDKSLIGTLLLPSIISVTIAGFFGFFAAYYLELGIKNAIENSFQISLAETPYPWGTLTLTLVAGIIATLPALWFPIKRILSVPVNYIFASGGEGWILSQFMDRYSLLCMCAVAFLLSAYLGNSILIAAINISSVAALVALIYFSTRALQVLINKYPPWKDLVGKMLIRNLLRQKERSLIWFLSLGFSLFFLLLGSFLSNSVQNQLSFAETEGHSNIVVMGASTDDQIALKPTLPPNSEEVPYLQVRIYSINGTAIEERALKAEETLETEGSSEFRVREYFVNIRKGEQLFPGEKITKGGQLFGPTLENKIVRASFEKGFAERLGLELNQKIVLEVAGISLDTQVVSFRTVDWYQFRPNFFILFSEEDIEGAPLNYINLLSVDDQSIPVWQKKIVEAFPHLNVLDLRQTRNQIMGAISKLSLAIQGSTIFLLLAALLVVVAVFLARRRELQQEFALLRCLGLSPKNLKSYLVRESFLTATLSWCVAAILALPSSIVVIHFVFKTEFHFPGPSLLIGSWLVTLIIVIALNLIMNKRTLELSPQILFSEGE